MTSKVLRTSEVAAEVTKGQAGVGRLSVACRELTGWTPQTAPQPVPSRALSVPRSISHGYTI
jgi:hypothetical protein